MASSFFLSFSISFRLALLTIDEMALWHREGMSTMFGGSLSFRIVVASVGVCIFSICGPGSGWFLCVWGVVVVLFRICRLAALRSFVRRLSCLLSEFVRGVFSLSGACGVSSSAIGQIC